MKSACIILRGMVLMLMGVAPAFGFTFSQDFNSVRLPTVTDQINPYPGWTVRVDGQVWYDVRFAAQGPDSSVCLVLRASVVDQGMTDAAVRIRFDLNLADADYRFLLDDDAVFQWDWWYRDNRLSEAVGARLIYRRAGELGAREHWSTPFYTPNTGFDPALVWDCHRMELDDLASAAGLPADEDIEIVALEFELRGPVNQELRVDNLYLGPRVGVTDCAEVRHPGFLVQKLQSYSATLADLDLDGRWDVLLPGFLGRTAQFWSGRDATFTDRAAEFGLDRYLGDVALFLDVDNDGDLDLVSVRVEHDGIMVLENLGHGRFASQPRTYATLDRPLSIAALAAADADGDGYLDLHVAVRDHIDLLMLGDGRGGFRPAEPGASPLTAEVSCSNGVIWVDLDGDGDQDQLVAGAGVLENDGAGRFTLSDPLLAAHRSPLVEGMTVEDFDGDGFLDVYLGVDQDSSRRAFSGRNLMFWGAGDGTLFLDRRSHTVLADVGHCQGVAAADFDHDGHLDLFIGNRSGPSLCLLGRGGGVFEPDHGRVFGSLEISDLAGVVACDRDDDGDQDVLILRKHNDPVVLENLIDDDRFLKVRLLGVQSNWDAIGAVARLYRPEDAGRRYVAMRTLRAGDGYQIAGPLELHFGLPDPGPFELEVTFPSSAVVTRSGLRAGQRVVVVEADGFLASAWHLWTRVHAPFWSVRLALWPMPLQHLLMALLTALCVLVWWPLLRRAPGPRPSWRPVASGVALVALLGLGVRHHVSWQGADAWALAFSLPAGLAAGASLPLALRHLRRPRSPVTIWDRLNEEFIGYTHTGWCKNLETLIRQGAMLSGDLGDDDRALLMERWRDAHEHVDGAVAAKLHTIAELGLSLDETRPAARDLAAGLRRLRRARRHRPDEVAAAARDLRQTADRIAAIVEARLSCRVDTAAQAALRAQQADLEAAGIDADLDTDPVAGIAVRIREHELVMVLQDILRNAADAVAGRPAPRIVIRAEADIRRVVLTVTDNGPGLGGRDPEQLCQAGFTTKDGGSGFGLYHARKTLGRYRGVLSLADAPGGGLMVGLALQRPLHARHDRQRTSP
jgi:signal transduction histidine kinase